MIRVKRLDHFGVDVSDLDRAERFYTEVLGMSAAMRLPDQRLLRYGDGSCALFLKPDRVPGDPEQIRSPLGKSHHAFEVAWEDLEAALHLFATTSMGILLGTLARSMPQFALLLMLILLPLQMLSGGATPYESMPKIVQYLMLAAPNTHFIMLAQAILYRGAGLDAVWPQFLAIVAIGAALFGGALLRFRSAIGTMA